MNEQNIYPIYPASPKALALCEGVLLNEQERTPDEANAVYPFKSLLVGESFTVGFDKLGPGTLSSLRSSATNFTRRLNRKFKVLVHDEYKCVEVARIC